MRPRSALVLLGLALAAWAAWFLWLREVPGTDERRERAGRLFPQFDAAAVTRLTLERPGGPVVLVRGAAGWTMEQPVRDRADAFAVDGLLRDIAEARTEGWLPAADVRGGDAATGLGPRALVAHLETSAGRRTLAVGTEPAPGDLRYASIDAEPRLALVPRALAEALERPADDLRDKALLEDAETAAIRRWRVTRAGGPTLAFERRGTDEWWITEPLTDDADDALAGGALSRLTTLRADRFADPGASDAALGLDAPEFAVELFGTGDAPLATLRLGRALTPSGERHAAVSGRDARFVVLPGTLPAELSKEPDAYRSRLALEFSVSGVQAFTLQRGTASARAIRGAEAEGGAESWTADGRTVDAAKVRQLLTGLARVEARRLADGVSAQEAGLATPAAALRIDDGPTFEIGGPASPGDVYARRAGRPAIVVIDADLAATIDPTRLSE